MPSIVFLVSVCLLGDPLVLRVPKNEIVTKHIETRVNRSWPVLCAASESLQAALVTAPKAPFFFRGECFYAFSCPEAAGM
jgi:hypothetical protein